ncbi:MAG TPA: hypothetical protein VJA86_02020 [Candidatus Nanoarchaeia archaeon]|nr:hypothetical protein [Candidatus Nanoarchaeia archaeon]
MNILFICRHNRFRSKVAEAIFNKLNRNKSIKAESAGIIKDIPASKNVRKVMKDKRMKLKSIISRRFNEGIIRRTDIIVIVADNVSKGIFRKFRKKIIVWKISDVSQSDVKGIRKRVGMIEKRVAGLIKNLNG